MPLRLRPESARANSLRAEPQNGEPLHGVLAAGVQQSCARWEAREEPDAPDQTVSGASRQDAVSFARRRRDALREDRGSHAGWVRLAILTVCGIWSSLASMGTC